MLSPEVSPGESVVIVGAGGGLAHIGVQIAAKLKGYKVLAVDGGEEKKKLCTKLGATEFIDYTKEDVVKRIKKLTEGEGAHAVVVVAGAEKAYEQAPELVRNCGTLVCVGLPRGDFRFLMPPISIANRGLIIKGSSTGTEKQLGELFRWNLEGKVVPTVEVHDFEKAPSIIEKLTKYEVTGRMVVRVP